MPEQFLFVYGTLRNGSGIPQQRLLRMHADLLGDARINAVMFDLGGYPGIILSNDAADYVKGELYALRPEHQATLLAELDEYEECTSRFIEPHEFRRELVSVQLEHNSANMNAWVYLYNRTPEAAARITNGDYRKS